MFDGGCAALQPLQGGAGIEFDVSQVVDKTKGVHALIPKADFAGLSSGRSTVHRVGGAAPPA